MTKLEHLLDELIEAAEWKGANEQTGYAAGDPRAADDAKEVEGAKQAVLSELGALNSGPVAVKALEWRQVIPGRMFADIYMIERLYLDDWRLFLRANYHGDMPKFIAGPFSLGEAKAAAQADFDQRIRSALQVKP